MQNSDLLKLIGLLETLDTTLRDSPLTILVLDQTPISKFR